MELISIINILILSYIIGAIPFGFIFVKMFTGRDIRTIQSGRTGGTNAMRAGGVWTGLATGLLDIIKGASTIWLVRNSFGVTNDWVLMLCPIMAIIGHNYSVFLIQRNSEGKLKIGGGAGGATCLGGAIGLWPQSGLIIFIIGALIFYFVGYASVTTMSIAFMSTMIFAYRAVVFDAPIAYVFYGILAELLLIWALRPNIKALIAGTERLHGYRARK
jgi:acyl phosphate:glycerol-3-phosphate acyltransferase